MSKQKQTKTNQDSKKIATQPNYRCYQIWESPFFSWTDFRDEQKVSLSALARCNEMNFSCVVQYINLLVAKPTVQCSQVQSSVSQTPTVTFIPIAFAFCSSEN